jgi:predicted metalloprotease
MGLSDKVHNAQQQAGEAQANALSVRLELQADCFAGVWAFHANRSRSILEAGDVDAALAAATAIGDDTLQRQSQGTVVPDSFTHGTSAQRVSWFKKGIESGQIGQCDTFNTRQL